MKGSEKAAQPKEPTKPKGILKGSSSPPKQSKQQQRDEDERRRIMFEMDSGGSASAGAEEALRRARAEEAERDRRNLLGVKNMKVTESRQVTID